MSGRVNEEIPVPSYVNWNRDGLMWNVHRDMEPSDYSDSHPCQAQDCPNTRTRLNQLPGKPPSLQNRWFCELHTMAHHQFVQIAQYNKIEGEGRVEFVIEGARKLGYLKLVNGRFFGTK